MTSYKIAFLASEVSPFAKTGGLADVARALPRTLGALGHEVSVFMPLYGSIDVEAHDLEPLDVIDRGTEAFTLYRGVLPRSEVPVYFIHAPRYYERKTLYTQDDDEPLRFSFFCRAVLRSCQHLRFAADIFHLNDWQTALVPLLLKMVYSWDRLFRNAKTLLTVHNLAYQGVFAASGVEAIGADIGRFFDEEDLKAGFVNFLKTGLLQADRLSTVSPTYAREIQTPEQGYGLDGVLRQRRGDLVGILNGVDYDEWNPRIDPLIPFRYSEKSLFRKKKNKIALAEKLGLTVPDGTPLVGMVTRLSVQKGIDLLPEVLPEMLSGKRFALVVLGTGELHYERFFQVLQARFPDRVCSYRGFHDELAHFIEAAADVFLMPSHYEPCGLNQMYSLKYGTVPVVRETGGLADSVHPYDPTSGDGTGIVFEHYTPDGVRWALETALALYREPDHWRRIVRNGMAEDFSWVNQAESYLAIYRQLLIH